MRMILSLLALLAGPLALAEDAPAPAPRPEAMAEAKKDFDWRGLVGKAQEEAVKAMEEAGWKYVVCSWDTKRADRLPGRCLYVLVEKGKVTGVVCQPGVEK